MTISQKNGPEVAQEFTDIIGGSGRYQIGIFIFCFFGAAAHCLHDYTMTFFAPNIDHWCARPQEALQANISVDEWKNLSLPLIKSLRGFYEHSQCTRYNISIQNGSLYPHTDEDPIKCSSWEYDNSVFKGSMVEEWDLVCDREWMVPMSKTVYMAAFLISSPTCGQLSDKFGRRRVIIACICVFLTFSFLTLLSTNIIMFMVFRFCLALGVTFVYVGAVVILTENVSLEYRSIYLYTYKYGWTIASMILPLIAWLIPSWFWLHFAFTMPWVTLLCVFWVLPETPRWLLTKRKFKELEKLLLYAAKKNGKNVKEAKIQIQNFIAQQPLTGHKEQNATALDLLRTPGLRKNTFVIFFNWFIISYIYYALSWNTNDLAGNPYWNFFLIGAVEFPEAIIFIPLCKRIGHRYGVMLSNVMSGVCLIAMVFVPYDRRWMKTSFAMLGKLFSAAAFDTIYIYTGEIFPTVVRNVAIGTSSTCARVGALLSPFINEMAALTFPALPLALPGALSVFIGILLFLLPDTKGKKLPDTLKEGERFAKNQEIDDIRETQPVATANGAAENAREKC